MVCELSHLLEADECLETGRYCVIVRHQGESEDNEVTVVEETILLKNAQQACSTVRKFMQQRNGKLGNV